MVLCQTQTTHEKLKSENKNLLKTNCCHLLLGSEGKATVGEAQRVGKQQEEWGAPPWPPPSQLTEGPPCEALVSWSLFFSAVSETES